MNEDTFRNRLRSFADPGGRGDRERDYDAGNREEQLQLVRAHLERILGREPMAQEVSLWVAQMEMMGETNLN
ncbi:MAG: hypothetical protein AAGI63_18380 [Planctomycetota bacterium]